MKIGLRGGHSPYAIGAVGVINEYVECQKVYKRTAELLRAAGHTVIDCNTSERTSSSDLWTGTNIANRNNADFFASIHMNAGGGTGCEVWAYNSSSSTAVSIGNRICKNISGQLGFPNRGVKFNSSFHDLRNTSCQAIIIEALFVDSRSDCSKLDIEKIARSIANGIDSSIPLVQEKPAPPVYHVDYLMVYNDGATPDKEVANTMAMILKAKGYNTKSLSASEYADNKYGDYVGNKIILIGGSLKDKFKCDKLIAGNNRYDTAFKMYEYLSEIL